MTITQPDKSKGRPLWRRGLLLSTFLFALIVASSLAIKPPETTITSASANLSKGTLNIVGTNFVAPIAVNLDNTNLVVNTFTSTTIDANLPAGIGPGSYRLRVSTTSGIANLDLTLDNGDLGNGNTAKGDAALASFTTATDDTAFGSGALNSDSEGHDNTAVGFDALSAVDTGDENTAIGSLALRDNVTGNQNTAVGRSALVGNTASQNTAVGLNALLRNSTGFANVAVGLAAGSNASTGDHNVYIGAGMNGVAGESNACYIASIFGQTSASGATVLINSNNKLGTMTSSKRFKEAIKPIDRDSEALYSLKPVTFRYKKDIDPDGTSQFGLVAEDVEKINPSLIVRDKEGKPYSVRYDAVNAMLLNEFLKEHCKAQEQEKKIDALTAQLKNHSAQLESVIAQLAAIRSRDQVTADK